MLHAAHELLLGLLLDEFSPSGILTAFSWSPSGSGRVDYSTEELLLIILMGLPDNYVPVFPLAESRPIQPLSLRPLLLA
jgi:hypothetical protein